MMLSGLHCQVWDGVAWVGCWVMVIMEVNNKDNRAGEVS